MNLYELSESESNPVYQQVESSNHIRHYDFLLSVIQAAIDSNQPWLSESLIKAINYHAIVGLHSQAGQYRPYEVQAGTHSPPDTHRVPAMMENFVNVVNWHWQSTASTLLAAYALWRLNYIHPFVNGNGRTARAACYYILCVKAGGLLPGNTILPEIIRNEPRRTDYVAALQQADAGDLSPLATLVNEGLKEQLA